MYFCVAVCPPGYLWRPALQTCHKLLPHPANQTVAMEMCAETGGNLVAIETAAEQHYIEFYVKGRPEKCVLFYIH